jgi:hypothetical protein
MRLLCWLTLCPLLLRAEGVQGWYQHTVWLRLDERWSVGNFADLRADDGVGDVHTWIVSPRVRYDLDATWQLQANLSALETLNADETVRADWLRLEFEVNPTFRLNDALTLSFRDRVEWRWRDGGDEYTTRIRVRPQLDWTLRNAGLFRGLYANNEVFFDFNQERVTENRLTPLGLTLRPWENGELRCFYLHRTTRGPDGWRDYDGFGVSAAFNY